MRRQFRDGVPVAGSGHHSERRQYLKMRTDAADTSTVGVGVTFPSGQSTVAQIFLDRGVCLTIVNIEGIVLSVFRPVLKT